MRPNFWKLSQGPQYFSYAEIIESIAHGLVYLHKDTGAKGTSAPRRRRTSLRRRPATTST